MKKLKYLILLLLIMPIFANAKSVKLTCNYIHVYDQLGGSPEIDVKCDIYDDYSHQCYMTVPSKNEKNNKEKIMNWTDAIGVTFKAQDYVKTNNKCPDYLVVKADSGFDGFELHAMDTYDNALALQNSLWGKRYIATNKDFEYTDEEKKKAEENITNSIEQIKEEMDNYDLSECKDDSKIITRISECHKVIDALRIRIGSEVTNVDNYVKQNILSEDDKIVKQFRKQIESAKEFIEDEQRILDAEDQKIKEELGLSEGNYQGKWDPDSLCGANNENCNIDITAFCTNPYVSRTLKFLGILLTIAKILVPAIIIVLGFVDLAKIIISGKVEDARKQASNIGKRIAIGIIIFLIPTILITIYNVAYNIANDSTEVSDGNLIVPENFKNCVGCILDATNSDACIVNNASE